MIDVMLKQVVVVTDSLSIDGGTSRVALESAMALAKRGIKVTVFGAIGEPSRELRSCAHLTIVSTNQTYALNEDNRIAGALRGLWNRKASIAMRELLDKLDPADTVVHLHCWTKALSSSVVASITRAGFPIVLTLHEFFSACPTGCLYLHRDAKVCSLKPMSLPCILTDCDSRSYAYKLYRVARQFVTRKFGKVPSGIHDYFAVSKFSVGIIERYLPPSHRIHMIGNPVDAVQDVPVQVRDNEMFVYVGRLSAEKGCALLAEAARITNSKLLFIGDGPERETIARLNPNAEITGWLEPAQVLRRLRSARCVVVPSLWYETFGLVVLEASALGVPAIVPTDTAPCELIVPNETGLTFKRGDVQSLAAQLRVLSDNATVQRLGSGAYNAFWLNPPLMRAHVDRLLIAYRNILATRQSPTMRVGRPS